MPRRKRTYEDTPETLLKTILVMQDKILKLEKEFKAAPLSIEVEMADGRWVERPNPFVQEYRALVKDFSQALKVYKELTGEEAEPASNNLAALRAKFIKVTA